MNGGLIGAQLVEVFCLSITSRELFPGLCQDLNNISMSLFPDFFSYKTGKCSARVFWQLTSVGIMSFIFSLKLEFFTFFFFIFFFFFFFLQEGVYNIYLVYTGFTLIHVLLFLIRTT